MILSIIIPVYNAEKTLKRLFESLVFLGSGNPMVEILFIDDGSLDSSGTMIRHFIKHNDGNFIHLIEKDNGGSASARNTGLAKAKGEWIFFLDADDELCFDPTAWLQRYPNHSALGFSVAYYKKDQYHHILKPPSINSENYLDVLTAKNTFTLSTLIFKKERLSSFFNPEYEYLEDWLFWIENKNLYANVKNINHIVSARIHIHGRNKTSHRKKNGEFRVKVAESVLKCSEIQVSSICQNNLCIQKKIGRIQQGLSPDLFDSRLFPCSPMLFVKLIFYILASRLKITVSPYEDV